jgi:hypothetical protein
MQGEVMHNLEVKCKTRLEFSANQKKMPAHSKNHKPKYCRHWKIFEHLDKMFGVLQEVEEVL